MAAVSSGNLYSAPAKLGSSLSAGPGGSWAGPLICSALSRSVLAILGPPCLRLSQQRPNPGLCPGDCAPGPALLDSRSWPYSCLTAEPPPKPLRVPPGAAQPLHMAPLPLQEMPPPRCSRGRSNLYTQSHCWSLSVLLPGQCMCPAALRELGALSWECRSLLVSQGAL